MLFYRAALNLSPATCTFVVDLITGHRDRIGSRWRALPPGRQALLVLVHLRCNERPSNAWPPPSVSAR